MEINEPREECKSNLMVNNSKIRKLYIFPEGQRVLSTGGILIAPTNDPPEEILDLTDLPDKDLEEFQKNIYSDKNLAKVRSKI